MWGIGMNERRVFIFLRGAGGALDRNRRAA